MIAETIGSIAYEQMQQNREANILGSARRGVYLHLASGWVVFLSKEAYHGPLTINVVGEHRQLDGLRNAAPAQIMHEGIFFPDSGLQLQIKHARVWRMPPRPQHILSPSQRLARLAAVIQAIASRKTTASLLALQALVPGAAQETEPRAGQLLHSLYQLQHALAEGQHTIVGESLRPLLGHGPGLTPSGDDLVAGLLLALNRWGEVIAPDLDLPALNRLIPSLANHKTTTLSANLIECAAQGEADERLVYALDGLMSGVPDAQGCAEYLVDWGNTSGIDALAGMAVAILNARI